MEQPPSTKAEDMLAEEIQGVDYPSMYHVYKPKRGMKRGEESKDTYKLPHRLIEKKRRDRINECISQLKDLLPEHLKLTTLGHLEKAVVLELTLKHVNGLTSLLEQQQQKILALQSGMPVDPAPDVRGQTEETFRSGFHLCAKEVLSYLSANPQSGGGGGDHLSPPRLVSHIQTLAAEVLQGGTAPARDRLRTPSPSPPPRAEEEEEEAPPARSNHHHHHHIHHHHHRDKPVPLSPDHAPRAEGYGRNCVPVIRRAFGGGGQWGPAGASGGSEQSGSDTDTDSGYGGEQASLATTANQQQDTLPLDHAHHYYYGDEQLATKRRSSSHFKQDGGNKRPRHTTMSSEEDDSLSGGESSSSSSSSSSLQTRPYMGVGRHPPTAPPLCAVPFYLLPPQAAAAYLPMLEKEAAAWYQPHPPRGAVLYPAAMGGVPPASSPPALLQALQQHHRQSTPPAIDLEAKD